MVLKNGWICSSSFNGWVQTSVLFLCVFLLVQGPQANFFIYVINTIVIVYFIVSELTLNPPEGIVAGPINEENFFDWECLIV